MKKFFGRRRSVAGFIAMASVWIALFAAVIWVVMMLWNWLMPALFTGARTIDYWQALGLFALCKILFGGGRGGRRWHRHREGMTDDERNALKRHARSHWHERWCRGDADQSEK